MFEKYSLADLFANIYKKIKINIIIVISLYLLVAIPLTYKTINTKIVQNVQSNFSSYIVYKIDAPTSQNFIKEGVNGGYGDFYHKLVLSGINGAYLFSDVSDNKLKEYSSVLGADSTALKNSNFDFWVKKITIYPIVDDKALSIEIFTPSKEVNLLVEDKIDKLINKYSNVYENTKVEKLETVYSDASNPEKSVYAYSKKSLLLKLVILAILTTGCMFALNFIIYIFNPSINRAGDYSRYKEIKKVFDIKDKKDLEFIRNYYQGELSFVTSKESIKKKATALGYDVLIINSISDLDKIDQVLFIEEYGTTRYKDFEKNLQLLNNFDKNILGVASYKL